MRNANATAANATTHRRMPALFTLGILLTLAAILSLVGAVQSAVPAAVTAQTTIDYDTDDDGYIEVSNHAQLDSIRLDLDGNGAVSATDSSTYGNDFPNRDNTSGGRMGCPSGACVGYELTADINLTTYSNWDPIGDNTNKYTGRFKGNGFIIDNLTISRSTTDYVGLFGSANARFESVGITNVSITADEYVGALSGANNGRVIGCWSTGSVTAGAGPSGGLLGWSNNANAITSSYSTASATGTLHVGGLIGACQGCGITNSYATGAVTRSSGTATTIGGLMGSGGTGTASYYDTTTSGCVSGGTAGCTTSAGGSGVTGQTTSALQTPVGYTGIYANWNANIDGVAGNDDPWYFGTTSQYPTLKYGKTDYDEDNDGYIDIATHAQLNAVRWDLDADGDPTSGSASAYNTAFPLRFTGAGGRMGCPSSGCTGYELTADIDLDTDGDGSADSGDEYWNIGNGWDPIGALASRYTGDFKGNGFIVDNLFISRSSIDYQGLFGAISGASRIETLGVTNANITGQNYVGVLAGHINGDVVACYTTGAITGGNFVGGLVGYMGAAGTTPSIHSSYSRASVTANFNKGGLVGRVNLGSITNSYSTGSVPGSLSVGGLVGVVTGSNAGSISVTGSYWDTQTSGQTTSIRGSGQSTAALQTPTGYTGIYADWNANIDGETGADDPWDFGSPGWYPSLKYGGHDRSKQNRGDYDYDDDGYIDIWTLAHLNAIRWDLNGDGDPSSGNATTYNAAFPHRDTTAAGRMGCELTDHDGNSGTPDQATCTGYELLASLTFDENGDGQVTATGDPTYWNSNAGWLPLGAYTSNFKGNGNTINLLTIARAGTNDVGLFSSFSSSSRIETVGITNATVTGSIYTGILAGTNGGSVIASYTTGSVSGTTRVGGIIGYQGLNAASIHSSYSTASVSGTQYVGGVLGQKFGSVTNSYATGLVSRASGGASEIGGLIGSSSQGTTTASYYDTTTSGCRTGGSNGCTGSPGGGTGYATAALQNPTGYTGIYSTWNANIDSVAGNDDPWDFGATTQYPILVLHLAKDYDEDNDGYIDISTLAQLDAVRHDLNGNGDATHADYAAAFPRRATAASERMGCPSGTCTGYELVASLDFDTNGDGSVTVTGDAYWNSGNGWNPIGTYTSNFKGNGHTINNLFISRASISNVGLFSRANSARIETLGVTNANVRGGANTGILLGYMNRGNMVACYTTGKVQGGDQTGGLVGYSGFQGGAINSSYSTAYVIGSRYVGGLLGFGTNGSITNSYSTGRVDPANDSGGFLGQSGANHTQSNNYWDTTTSGRSGGIGVVAPGIAPGSSAGVTGKTTRELQTVTEYTGIYENWNNNLDGQSGNDDPWAFGNNMQYPMLDYQSMSLVPQGGQAMGIPDNWNAPVTGERLGVCLTPADFPNRAIVSGQTYKEPWIWERSMNGDDWTVITGAGDGDNPPTYEYSPVAADVGRYIRAKVKMTDGSFATTRALGGRVSATTTADEGAEIPFVRGHAAPQVDTEIVAANPLPTGAKDARVGWQRCPSTTTAPHSDCTAILGEPGHWWIRYTPTADDVGFYLRMYAYYETGDGTWTRRVTPITGAVVAAQ